VFESSKALTRRLLEMIHDDLSADVLEVERRRSSDHTRGWGRLRRPGRERVPPERLPQQAGPDGGPDIPDDLSLARRLAAVADVVVEKFREARWQWEALERERRSGAAA
jgi:crotonobetainyl-CoA:carnitine CoA-transferase CaiB-like acyl-CoA transferase